MVDIRGFVFVDIYYNEFTLLRGKHVNIMTSNGSDSMLVPAEAMEMLCAFFEVQNYYASSWWYWDLDSLDSYHHIDGHKLLFNNRVIADGVVYADVPEAMILDGYIYLLFTVDDVVAAILVVVERDSFYFLGCISSCFGTMSSSDLSRLILITPEIDWNV